MWPVRGEDPVDDIVDFTEPAQRMKVRHTRIGGGVVPRPDYPQSDRVHPNPACRVLEASLDACCAHRAAQTESARLVGYQPRRDDNAKVGASGQVKLTGLTRFLQ